MRVSAIRWSPRTTTLILLLLVLSCKKKGKEDEEWREKLAAEYRPRMEKRLRVLKKIAEELARVAAGAPAAIRLGERPKVNLDWPPGKHNRPNTLLMTKSELERVSGRPDSPEWIRRVSTRFDAPWATDAVQYRNNPRSASDRDLFEEFLAFRYLLLLLERGHTEPEIKPQRTGPVLFQPGTWRGRLYLFDLSDGTVLGGTEISAKNDSKYDFFHRPGNLTDAARRRLLDTLAINLKSAVIQALKPHAP